MYANREDPGWSPITNRGFYQFEIDKLKRVHDLIKNNHIDSIQVHHKDFVAFIEEADRRRGTNFLETFPKLTTTFNLWKNNDIGAPFK
mgnify:CR=1 FL=1